jgi:hypothetical protein
MDKAHRDVEEFKSKHVLTGFGCSDILDEGYQMTDAFGYSLALKPGADGVEDVLIGSKDDFYGYAYGSDDYFEVENSYIGGAIVYTNLDESRFTEYIVGDKDYDNGRGVVWINLGLKQTPIKIEGRAGSNFGATIGAVRPR